MSKKHDLVQIQKEHRIKSSAFLPSGERTEETLVVIYGQKPKSGIWEVMMLPLVISAVSCVVLLMVTVTVKMTNTINAGEPRIINHTEGTVRPTSY